ncbi:3' terminal RNA ribose 2'-O-methyltransferase Hen1 [Patulibacter minatonensis]|uniref:3' terminal RNA ribose 2'-O-methyltransferase Hen1 n=1 Tax=Patulibacter minatonensis TaxID=298163 RepID=UPI0004BAD23B|nr:3' terminal RNA ribose 2'-O-methyltransferase Hen1 [Patulibacter minatonensis]
MLLTLTTTHRPATDLGFLLHKHPDRHQRFSVPFGEVHVAYPEATEERCTAALVLDVDPVGLVRRGQGGFALAEYVNDRPYVASSFLAVALVTVFKSAMAGTCRGHEELAATAIPLVAELPAVPARGGERLVRRLFEPLGYAVEVTPVPLDDAHPEWGAAPHVGLRLTATTRLSQLLTHLYVLLPVLDGEKHYWVDDTEIEKLLRRGEGWLGDHPERDLIVRRSLKHQARLVHPALATLAEDDPDPEAGATGDEAIPTQARRTALREHRLEAVQGALKASGARRVLDLGCGPGALLRRLLKDDYDLVVGADVSHRTLEIAHRRLRLDELHEAQRARIALWQTALTYRDRRLQGFDAAALVEVIEHLDADRLGALTANVFGVARPGTVVVTTPNAEYNVRWESLPAGAMRHPDHRFEWTRAEFATWTTAVCAEHGYAVVHHPVGEVDDEVGAPTQMAVFTRAGRSGAAGVGGATGATR